MKNINYSLWWWFVYQWYIWAFIKYIIDNFNKKDNFYTKTYTKDLKEIIEWTFSNFNEYGPSKIDILLEWNWNCFEDINLLYKEENEKNEILFFQIKWWNLIKIKDWTKNKDKVLSKQKVIHMFSNFLKNKNIYEVWNKSKFILITNKYFDSNVQKIIKWDDELLIANKIISEVRKKFKLKIKWRGIKKFELLVKNIIQWKNINAKHYWTTLPFDTIEDQENIILFIKNTIAIMRRTIILENFKINNIIEKLDIELWPKDREKLFSKIMESSIDISNINRWTKSFKKYEKYEDLFFTKDKKLSDLNNIREWKIL